MIYVDSIRRAGRSLRSAKGRTILTSLAIAVGAFTLTISLAAGEGARQYTDTVIQSNIDPQSIFLAKDESLLNTGPPGAGGLKEYDATAASFARSSYKTLSQRDIDTVRDTPDVARVLPTYLVSAQYFTIEGIDTKYITDVTAYDSSVKSDTAAGSLPALGTDIATDGVVLPEGFLDGITGKPSAESLIGKTLTLHLVKQRDDLSQKDVEQILATKGPDALQAELQPEERDVALKIVAVSAKSSTAFSASNGLFISQQQAKALSEFLTKGTDQYQRYITATATVRDGADPEVVKASIEANDITAKTANDLQGFLFSVVNTLQGIVVGFGVIALIASVFGIINTQYISVLERTSEIGLMKALGMRGRHVSRLFQLEAAWIGMFGGIIGAVIAAAVGTALNPWITDTLSLGEGNSLLIFQPIPIAILIVALMLIAMLAGWFPARKAARLDPIEALRTE